MLDKVLAALIAGAAPEMAAAPEPLQSTVDAVIPEEFKGDTEVKVKFVHPWDVERECTGQDIPDYIIYACYLPKKSFLGDDKIISPNPCAYPEARIIGTYAHLMCHEKAHKNGWRHKF